MHAFYYLGGKNMIDTILRANPNLVYYNYNGISDRMLATSDGDMFFVFNKRRNQIELHSCLSFQIDPSRISKNAVIKRQFLNDWIIKSFRSSETKKFYLEKEDERSYSNYITEKYEEDVQGKFISAGLNTLEDMLGRRL